MSPPQSAPAAKAAAQDPIPGAHPGRRLILVDGFNVLHAVLLGKERDSGWWRRVHRERLLERVTHWRGGADAIWVAFDGSRPAMSVWAEPVAMSSGGDSPGPAVHSVGSVHGVQRVDRVHSVHSLFVESADDWIVRRARRAEHPERMIVVSADRKVAGRARSAGCEILTPWAFMARCGRDEADAAEVSGSSYTSETPETPQTSDAPRSSASPESSISSEACDGSSSFSA